MGVVKLSTAGIRNYSKTSDFLSGNAPLSLTDFDLLETTTLTTNTSSVTFSGLGSYSEYKHLQIRWVARSQSTDNSSKRLVMQINSQVSVYNAHELMANGAQVGSYSYSDIRPFVGWMSDNGMDAGIYGAGCIDVLDYSDSSKNTTFRILSGVTGQNRISLASALYRATTPVSSMVFFSQDFAGFMAGTRFSIYGIKG